MEEKLYQVMNWAEIEAVVYSEEDHPHDLLGAHVVNGEVLIQAFFPGAAKASVKLKATGAVHEMEMADEEGFFAVLLSRKSIPAYTYLVEKEDGTVEERQDPYAFGPQLLEMDLKKLQAGIHYRIYDKLGAKYTSIKGTEGTLFAVWAPTAIRVSVVGEFNGWDGRVHQMYRRNPYGVYEIFIPGVKPGAVYQYELKMKNGVPVLKNDPYARAMTGEKERYSVVTEAKDMEWTDEQWLKTRRTSTVQKAPFSVYEIHLEEWLAEKRKKQETLNAFYSRMVDEIQEMGYTHVLFLPLMEHTNRASCGYDVTGYYAPDQICGTAEDLKYLINRFHEAGIGVLTDLVPTHFPRELTGLMGFDGTCLYEHLDERQSLYAKTGGLCFNYGRPEVSNFLIANAFYWVEEFHVDGLRMVDLDSMLYLDYDKHDGQWVANMYGGNENLEALELLKHMNSILKKKKPGVLLLAQGIEHEYVTVPVEKGGLGFDLKWNGGFAEDVLDYLKYDPVFRSDHYGELLSSIAYAYAERHMIGISRGEAVHGDVTLLDTMPGRQEWKEANVRLLYGYQMAYPGKKLCYGFPRGKDAFSESMARYMKEWQSFYQSHPALYELDETEDGLTFINNLSARENLLVFTRNTKMPEDTLLIVCNFSEAVYEKKLIGVPFEGKYKEVFNSDREEFGGKGLGNKRARASKKQECDDRENAVQITIPAMGILVFSYEKGKDKKEKV